MRSTKDEQSRRGSFFAAVWFIFAATLFAALRSHAAPQQNQIPKPAAAFVVVVDAAHGGSDAGAHLGDGAAEKDVTIALATRLRSLLEERGFTVITTRSAIHGNQPEADLSNDARAAIANRAHAQACIILHATASGNGVHLFTSSLVPADNPAPQKTFIQWQTAQAAYVTRSVALAAHINAGFAALTGREAIPATTGKTLLDPMDSITCPTVAVEVAPLTQKETHVRHEADEANYSQRVAETLAWSLEQWRSRVTGEAPHDDSLNPAHAGGLR